MKKNIGIFLSLLIGLFFVPLSAGADEATCKVENQDCVTAELLKAAKTIENTAWRDQTYREAAKTIAADGHPEEAAALIDSIQTPDTQAMTIRGVGMAAAELNLPPERYGSVFKLLREKAETITHPPSYAIALTYIAMAQAFAADHEGAWTTAASMKNDALRHKAFGETAEIQAEQGHFAEAMKSIGFIESTSYQNKAYGTVVKILGEKGYIQQAYDAATKITNPYMKAQAFQDVLNAKAELKKKEKEDSP